MNNKYPKGFPASLIMAIELSKTEKSHGNEQTSEKDHNELPANDPDRMAVNRDRNVDTMGNTEENQLGVSLSPSTGKDPY
jgi:hypothetical protein